MFRTVILSAIALPAVLVIGSAAGQRPSPSTKPTAQEASLSTEKATFAAGCFWGVENTFRKIPGVVNTQVGYAGGWTEGPTYKQVCTDRTGHAEAVQIEYDPAKVSYQTLLEVFFENHDPTTRNRQGPDFGSQYRSAIFFHSAEQERLAKAEKEKRDHSGDYVGPITTDIVADGPFHKAEEYHQRYYEKQGVSYSCHFGNGKKQKVEVAR